MEVKTIPPFNLIRKVLNRALESGGLAMIPVAPMWSQKEWFPDLSLLVEGLLPTASNFLESPGAASCLEVSSSFTPESYPAFYPKGQLFSKGSTRWEVFRICVPEKVVYFLS